MRVAFKPNKVLAIILGGGRGTRLYPLTKERCKPAISFGGKYRLIDIPISNCLHSGINQIFILTQFMTASIHRHIFQTYHFDMLSKGFIEILPAEQTHTAEDWYQGTADAVRHSIRYFKNYFIEDVFILSGDQLCRMDLLQTYDFHKRNDAELTIIGNKISEKEVSRMGIIKSGLNGKVEALLEKPKDLKLVRDFLCPDGSYLASTGNYIFKKEVLLEVLESSSAEDFGKQIIPYTVERGKVFAYPFEGYWEDIGTIRAFYQANLELGSPLPRLNLYDEDKPFFTRPRFLPAAKVQDSRVVESLISEGSMIEGAEIQNAVVGIRSVIHAKTKIKRAILLGNDYYQRSFGTKLDTPHIGKDVIIERAIIDKNVTIGPGSHIIGNEKAKDVDNDLYCVRDGIIVISKGTYIPAGTIIAPKQ